MVAEYIAECFWPGVKEADLEALDGRARRCAAATAGTPEEVRYSGSTLVPEDEVVLCFFGAPSEGAVRTVAERAGIPFARIVESTSVPAMAQSPEQPNEVKR